MNGKVAQCTQMRQQIFELVWTAEENYVAGTVFELRSKNLRQFITWTYHRIQMEKADIIFRKKVFNGNSERQVNPKLAIFKARLTYGAKKGEQFKISLIITPFVYAGSGEKFSVWITDPNNPRQAADAQQPEAEKETGSECPIPLNAAHAETLGIYSKPMPNQSGKVRTVLLPEDKFGNPTVLEKPANLKLEWEGKNWEINLSEAQIVYLDKPLKTARLKVTLDIADLGPWDNISNGIHYEGKIMVYGNPVWPDEVADGLRAAFGEFHWHTEFSGDGDRSFEEALIIARDIMNMDYAAPGDHNTMGERWEKTVSLLNKYNNTGDFATFFGWENGSWQGHQNYYFTDPAHPLVCNGSAGVISGNPLELLEKLKNYRDFIAVPHHTNAVAETRSLEDDTPYWHQYPWTSPVDYIRLVEIMQIRGNQERNDYEDVWRGWHQNNGSSVQDALELGYRIGFTGGTDNHWGWPGRSYSGPYEGEKVEGYLPKGTILTGILTQRIERQAVYDALWSRHTWAVWNTRALVVFKVNGALMGDEIKVAKSAELQASVRISAEDSFQSIEIVSEKQTVWCRTCADMDADLTISLGNAEKSTHFYMRALLRNGGIIYASPVFVDVV